KEDWLRASAEAFGHRYAMDAIVPGGVARDPADAALALLAAQGDALAGEVRQMRRIFDEHSGLQDRLITAGRVTPELARRLGLVGLAGRASGQAFDLRVDHPTDPYDQLGVKKAVREAGDLPARVNAGFPDLPASLRH